MRRDIEGPSGAGRGGALLADAVVDAVTGIVLCAVLGMFVLVAAFATEAALPVGLGLLWLAQTAVVAVRPRRAAPGRPGRPVAAAASAAAVASMVWWAVEVRDPLDALPVVDGVVLALGLVLWRAAAGGVRPRAVAAGAVAVLATAALALVALNDPAPQAPELAAPAVPVAPLRPVPPAVPPPSPTPAPVDARVACSPDDLAWSTTGWDAAMGTRAVAVVAVNRAVHPCFVEGIAGISIAQGGRPLALVAEPAASGGRVGLAPGGAASFALIWEGYGAAADAATPQELYVTLPGHEGRRNVPLERGPAPFDLVAGATIQVAPWQRASEP